MTTLAYIATAGEAAGWPDSVIALLSSDPPEAPARATVLVIRNGPYLALGRIDITDHLGVNVGHDGKTALCRCGQSAAKPTCDAACIRTGFDDAKSPDRVPDRRDRYTGQQVTVFDNRGICQHSGLCTDRLGAVFRSGSEPFVTPSGGRMDEIVRAVRDCPSGALSYGIDEVEARRQVDWNGSRPATPAGRRPGRTSRRTGASSAAGRGIRRSIRRLSDFPEPVNTADHSTSHAADVDAPHHTTAREQR
jgi:uncharacterized Fe-S cluster protein YjdI